MLKTRLKQALRLHIGAAWLTAGGGCSYVLGPVGLRIGAVRNLTYRGASRGGEKGPIFCNNSSVMRIGCLF